MLMAVLLALVVVGGQHPSAAAILAVAYLSPPAFLALAGAWAAFHAVRRGRARRSLPGAEADFLWGVASEIDAGASIRQAVIAAADRAPGLALEVPVRMAAAGRPAAEIAGHLRAALPLNGRMAAAAYRMVAETGASAGPVFSGLALRAVEAGDLERTRRVLTTQARVSAWVVGGLPIAVTGALMLTGRGPSVDGVAGTLTVVGAALIVCGGALVWLMVRDQ